MIVAVTLMPTCGVPLASTVLTDSSDSAGSSGVVTVLRVSVSVLVAAPDAIDSATCVSNPVSVDDRLKTIRGADIELHNAAVFRDVR